MNFDLASIQTGKARRPRREIVYGPPGVGKTTFAAGAPSPICIQTEDGADEIGMPRFPKCETFADVAACFNTLAKDEHPFKTVVIDSLDWMERLIHDQVARDNGAMSIQDPNCKAFAFGKGFEIALLQWRQVIGSLDYLRNEKGIGCVLIAHSQVKRYDDPRTESYERFQPALHKAAIALLVEWSDAMLFAGYETFVKGGDDTKARGVGTGNRVLYTDERPSHIAKNRWGLPEVLPLDYAALTAAYEATRGDEQSRTDGPTNATETQTEQGENNG